MTIVVPMVVIVFALPTDAICYPTDCVEELQLNVLWTPIEWRGYAEVCSNNHGISTRWTTAVRGAPG